MAWTKDPGAKASRQPKWKKTRRASNERLDSKSGATSRVPSQLSFSQQELIRVQCFMSGYKLTDRSVGSGAYAKVYLADVTPEKMIVDPLMGEIALQGIAPQVSTHNFVMISFVSEGFLMTYMNCMSNFTNTMKVSGSIFVPSVQLHFELHVKFSYIYAKLTRDMGVEFKMSPRYKNAT